MRFLYVLVLPLLLASYGLMLTPRFPSHDCGGTSAAENAARATLRNIVAAQRTALESELVDADGDGVADLATFAELAGVAPLRSRGVALSAPPLPRSFGVVNPAGEVERTGYRFRIQGPGASESGRAAWGVYAWPSDSDLEDARVFYADAEGTLWARANEDERYFGNAAPPPWAAWPAARSGDAAAARAPGRVGRDGGVWTPLAD